MLALPTLLLAALAAVSSPQRGPVPPQSPPQSEPTQTVPTREEARPSEPPLRERDGAGRREAPPALDADTEAWARSLVSRLGDPNRAIARSAAAGLIALGPPVVPMLRRVAESGDPQMARLAHHALGEIRLGPPHLRRPGGPEGPGANGRSPRGGRPGDTGPREGPRGERSRGDGPRGEPSRGEGPRGQGARNGPDGGPLFPPPQRDGARRDLEPRGERRHAAPPHEAPLPRERARRGPDAPRPSRHDDREAI